MILISATGTTKVKRPFDLLILEDHYCVIGEDDKISSEINVCPNNFRPPIANESKQIFSLKIDEINEIARYIRI